MRSIMFDVLEINIVMSLAILILCLFAEKLRKRYGAMWLKVMWIVLMVRLLIPYNFSLPVTEFRLFSVPGFEQEAIENAGSNVSYSPGNSRVEMNPGTMQPDNSGTDAFTGEAVSVEQNETTNDETVGMNSPGIYIEQNEAGVSATISDSGKENMSVVESGDGANIDSVANADGSSADVDGAVTDASRTRMFRYTDIFMYIWLIGIGVSVIYHIMVYFVMRQTYMKGLESVKNASLQEQITELQKKYLGRNKLSVYQSDKVQSPVITGVIRPKLIIPSYKNNWDSHELELITAHELCHYRKKDLWLKMLMLAVTCFNWFNPAVYMMKKQFYYDMELVCDESVMRGRSKEEKETYAKILMSFAGKNRRNYTFMSGLAAGNKLTKNRIYHIWEDGKKKKGVVVFAMILVAFLGISVFVSCGYKPGEVGNEELHTFLQAEVAGVSEVKIYSFQEAKELGQSWEIYGSASGEPATWHIIEIEGVEYFYVEHESNGQMVTELYNYAILEEQYLLANGIQVGESVEEIFSKYPNMAKVYFQENSIVLPEGCLGWNGTSYPHSNVGWDENYEYVDGDYQWTNQFDYAIVGNVARNDDIEAPLYVALLVKDEFVSAITFYSPTDGPGYFAYDINSGNVGISTSEPISDESISFAWQDVEGLCFQCPSLNGDYPTWFYMFSDGSFSGGYKELYLEDTGENYPDGTIYLCNFEGKFAEPKKINAYTYSLEVSTMTYEEHNGSHFKKDDLYYYYVPPMGLYDLEELVLYTPGAPLNELPAGFLASVGYNPLSVEEDATLPFYGIYNVKEEKGFCSFYLMEEVEDALDDAEDFALEYSDMLANDTLTEAECFEYSKAIWEQWELTLDYLTDTLNMQLDGKEIVILKEQNEEWITARAQEVEEYISTSYANDPLESMYTNLKMAEITRDRVYELRSVFEVIYCGNILPEEIFIDTSVVETDESGNALLYTTQYELEPGQLCQIKLYGKMLNEYNYGISYVKITSEAGKDYSFATEEAMTEIWGQKTVYTECWEKDGGIKLEDINFDGYVDIGLMAQIPAYNLPYIYYVFDADSREYKYFGDFMCFLQVDVEAETCLEDWRSGTTYYADVWAKDNEGGLYLMQRTIREYDYATGEFTDTTEYYSLEETSEPVYDDESYLTQIDDPVYRELITDILDTGKFPVQENEWDGNPYESFYGVADVDADGQDELIINWCGGMVTACYIYDYNRETKEAYIQHIGYNDMVMYDSGYIIEEDSHDQGRSSLDDFWPYSVKEYNPQNDVYEHIVNVAAWTEDCDWFEPAFPTSKDIDGDGVVYYNWTAENWDNPTDIMDNAEYEEMYREYTGGNPITITWNKIISKEEYEELYPRPETNG